MRILGWLTVGLFYIFMVWRNLSLTSGASTLFSDTFFLNTSFHTYFLMILLLVFSGLISLACVLTWDNPVVENAPGKIKRLAFAGIIALLVQFFLGSQMKQLGGGLACPNFPNCLETFLPSPFTYETAIAFTHRWWGFLLLGHFFHLALAAARTAPALAGPARRVFALSVAQVLLGIGTVLSGLNAHSRILHAAVGYALWGILFFILIRAGGARWLWTPIARAIRKP